MSTRLLADQDEFFWLLDLFRLKILFRDSDQPHTLLGRVTQVFESKQVDLIGKSSSIRNGTQMTFSMQKISYCLFLNTYMTYLI